MNRVHSSAEGGASIPGELVARLETAPAGSRELDGLVEVAIRNVQAARAGLKREHWAKWRSNRDGHISDGHTFYDSAPVTNSLDAALALAERVLPGWFAGMQQNRFSPHNEAWSFWLETPGEQVERQGATAALAACIAILKATTAPEADAVGATVGREPQKSGTREGADR